MAYCTNAQVAGEFKKITFNSTSSVTDTEVDRFITEADAEIDSRLGLKYVTPITGSTALILARQLSIWLVAHRVKEVMRIRTGAEPVNQELEGKDLRKQAMDMIDKYVDGTQTLSDATLRDSDDGVESFAVDEDLEHQFSATEDNW